MKALFGMADIGAALVGPIWTVPGFSTLPRRQQTLAAQICYRGSNAALHLLPPSRACCALRTGRHCTKLLG